AIARYSQLESWILHDLDRAPERREKARTLAERALQLQPDLPEAHLALGFSYYYGDNNFDAALREFEIARGGLPNESEVYLAIGAWQVKSKLAIFERGDFSVAEKAFEALKSVPTTNEQKLKIASDRADVFLLERKYREGLDQAESLPDDQLSAFPGHFWSKYY